MASSVCLSPRASSSLRSIAVKNAVDGTDDGSMVCGDGGQCEQAHALETGGDLPRVKTPPGRMDPEQVGPSGGVASIKE